MTYRKKLIEVALPLEAINAESAREKSIRHGHPSTLHLWWARRPLAACRAVLFAQMVDDPSSHPELFPTEAEQNEERERLFDIIRELVLWENVNNEKVLERARAEIRRYAPPEGLPPVLDPFAGGGSIPLEAQRLGLEAHASDLNPVAVLINKALIEIPPKFANMPPVNPESRRQKRTVEVWRGAQGLAEDVRYYGQWMRDEAEKRIGHLYPKVTITEAMLAERPDLREQGLQVGEELTVITWLWARTVTCPNPACQAQMPLLRLLSLSTKRGSRAWLNPIIQNIDRPPLKIEFEIEFPKDKKNKPNPSPKTGRGAKFRCLACGQVAGEKNIRQEFQAKRDGSQLVAIVASYKRNRIYFSASQEQIQIANEAKPTWVPDLEMNQDTTDLVSGRGYGITHWHELFTARQLALLTTFSDLVKETFEKIQNDVDKHSYPKEYASAVATYLGEAVSKLSTFHNKLAYWRTKENKSATGFGRQALAMTWDYAEVNPFAEAGGDFSRLISEAVPNVLINAIPAKPSGYVQQANITRGITNVQQPVICTDPPYYDNVAYADLSDFFYIWLRHSLKFIYPDLFQTLTTPKLEELVALAHRFDGDSKQAGNFFEQNLNLAFTNIYEVHNSHYPLTVFYAFKQAEEGKEGEGVASTGWETMLEGLTGAGFTITGTWPVRTETTVALKTKVGALASSIVLVCRLRPKSAPTATRRDFLNALRRELPSALRQLQKGYVAPVDLAQASIGPGMAIFSRYSQVIEADGSPMRVRTALALINQALDEYLSEQEGEYDPDTRWALAWFEQFGFKEGAFGDAETLSKAKNTSVGGMVQAGFLEAGGGKVRLLRREELNPNWDPASDPRLTVWEVTQHLIRTMEDKGETAAATLLNQVGPLGEAARDLAYRLYQICERKGWAQEALPYNGLVVAWSDVGRLAIEAQRERPVQRGFDF